MYSYLTGEITEIMPDSVTLEINNVGFHIKCANPYKYKKNLETKIYTYQYVKEDEISLYGFEKREELTLFLKLISVKGLGCKMALPLFASNEQDAIISAIEKEDVDFLKKFPKIGDKVAKQIILDLKGKLTVTNVKVNNDLLETLKALGYKKSSIDSVIPKIDEKLSLEQQIKEALKLL